jgi:hypothetical protein
MPRPGNDDPNPNSPIHKEIDGRVEAAVWRRVQGDGQVSHHVTLSKSYPVGNGKWDYSSTFSMEELDRVIACAGRAQEWVIRQRQERARDKAHQEERTARQRDESRSLRHQEPDRGAARRREEAGDAASRADGQAPPQKVTLDTLAEMVAEKLYRMQREGRER